MRAARQRWAASGTESGARGVFARAAPMSVLLKWPLTSANPAAQCRYEVTLHALFFSAAWAQWLIRAAILFTLVRFLLPVIRSRANFVERQFRICVVIGCHIPDAEEIARAGSALCCWMNGSWCPLDDHSEWFLSGNWVVAARVGSW